MIRVDLKVHDKCLQATGRAEVAAILLPSFHSNRIHRDLVL